MRVSIGLTGLLASECLMVDGGASYRVSHNKSFYRKISLMRNVGWTQEENDMTRWKNRIKNPGLMMIIWLIGSILAIAGFFFGTFFFGHSAFELAFYHSWPILVVLLVSILVPFIYVLVLIYHHWRNSKMSTIIRNFQSICLLFIGSAFALPLLVATRDVLSLGENLGIGFYSCEAGSIIAVFAAIAYFQISRCEEFTILKEKNITFHEKMEKTDIMHKQAPRINIRSSTIIIWLCIAGCLLSFAAFFLPWQDFIVVHENTQYLAEFSGYDLSVGVQYGSSTYNNAPILFSIPIAAMLTVGSLLRLKRLTFKLSNLLWGINLIVIGQALASSIGLLLVTGFAPAPLFSRSHPGVAYFSLLEAWVLCIVGILIAAACLVMIANRLKNPSN